MERAKRAEPKPKVAEAGGIRWTNYGGNFRLPDGRVIKRKESFLAPPEQVPVAFRDIVRPLDPLPETVPLVPIPGGFEVRERAEGQFDIVDSHGKRINENPMSEEDANAILAKLK